MTNNFQFNIESQRSPGWLERAEKSASLLHALSGIFLGTPTLADMGCGDQKLRAALVDRGIDCLYQGFDINPQSLDVKKFDVNTDELEVNYDVIVALGLTEYVDLYNLLISMRKKCSYFVVSHVLKNAMYYTDSDLIRLGWINHLSGGDFEKYLLDAGFNVMRTDMTKNGKVKIWLCN